MGKKRMYKSNDRKVCGVCGGLAEYFGIDPTIVRLVYAILAITYGSGLLLYIIAAIIMEDRPDYELTHCSEWQHVGVTPYVEGAPAYCELRYSDYADFSLTALMPYETAVFMVGAVIIGILSGLLLAVIPYFKKRSIWEAYDYRKKATEAIGNLFK